MIGLTLSMAASAPRLARAALALFLAATAQAAAAPVSLTSPHPAVCRVVVEERDGLAFGSGTLIDARGEYGLVVTNWHVVQEATGKIKVVFPSGFKTEARPIKLDETWDLAALVVWRPPAEPVSLAPRAPAPGEPLTICGYGQGNYRAAPGRCTDYYSPEVGMPQELVELDVEARQGDSGGPIFNARGEMAGVLFGAGQGTTLGSFGGRVGTFLATLAPGIGAPPATLVAVSKASQPLPSRTGPSRPPQSTVDPFLVAERAAPQLASASSAAVSSAAAPSAAPPPTQPAPERIAPSALSPPAFAASVWPSTLADKPAAPNRVIAKQPASTWQSSPAPVFETNRPAAAVAGFEATAPLAVGASPEGPGHSIDWWEDGRSLLALFGVAALVIHGMRAMG